MGRRLTEEEISNLDPQKKKQYLASQRYYENNKEKIKIKTNEYRLKDPERTNSYSNNWKKNNPEKRKESGKLYREKNAEKIKQYRGENKESNYQRVKEWRKNNPEKVSQHHKNYSIKHKEEIKNYQQQYFIENKETILKRNKEYNEKTNYFKNRYKNNLEKFREYNKEYRQKNKEIIYIRNKRRRDLERNPDCKSTLTLNQARIVYHKFNHQCYKCGSKERLCLDHYHPLIKGNPLSIDNAIILCVSCNCSKGGRPPHRFFTIEEMELLYSKYGISRTPINSNNNHPFLFGNLEYSDLVIG